MNVQELIEELDGFGGHMPAKVEIPASAMAGTLQRRDDDTYFDFDVDARLVMTEDGQEQMLLITPR